MVENKSPSALAVTFKYKANSEMLEAVFEAVERNILK
jgi:hypothetical protein